MRGLWLAPLRLLAALRILRFPSRLREVWSLQFMAPYLSEDHKRDAFFYLTHDYYLSRFSTVAQRIDCAVAHYAFEVRNHGARYHRAVYHSSCGLALWERLIGDTRYSLVLRATEDYRYEGDLSILLFADNARVCRISFSYVSGAQFGLEPECTMFVTRNQTDRGPELQRFREAFKQNSPPYFCLAAVCGIAMANGMPRILMVKDDAQIAYADQYASGFRNSYSELWKAFGAEEIGDRRAVAMSIPPKISSLSSVTHKSRAISRRRNWMEIALAARRVMLENRIGRTPQPLPEQAYASLLDLREDQIPYHSAIARPLPLIDTRSAH